MTESPIPRPALKDDFVPDLRLNVAFERMVVASVIGAAASGAAMLALSIAGGIISASGLSGIADALYKSAVFSAVCFIAGFAAATMVGAPMYRILEKQQYRRGWPYVLAASIFAFALTWLAVGPPSVEAPGRFLFLAPAVLTALIFVRSMKSDWRAADEIDARSRTALTRIH